MLTEFECLDETRWPRYECEAADRLLACEQIADAESERQFDEHLTAQTRAAWRGMNRRKRAIRVVGAGWLRCWIERIFGVSFWLRYREL